MVEPGRILLILPNWMGDVLFVTPSLHEIRLRYPQSSLTALVWPSCRPVLEGNPDINEVLPLDEKNFHKGFWGKIKLILELRRRNFDTVFLFSRSRTRGFISLLSRIPQRIGYQMPGKKHFLTHAVDAPPYDSMHRVEYYLGILRGMGFSISKKPQYVLEIDQESEAWAQKFFKEKGIKKDDLKIVLNAGGNWAPKRWSAILFGKLAKKMMELWGAKIILTGVSQDHAIFEAILKEASYPLVSAIDRTHLKQLAALFKNADLYIGNDSGPTHLAQAVKAPLIALFGPQDPKITGPYGEGKKTILFKNKGCQVPCFLPECEWKRCIDTITVEEVFEAAEKIVQSSRFKVQSKNEK
ncbi:MAG: lipopolysaccharide heptosyltransferase II [Chlamydiae bacterium]|nr:lipopolysaccharide heptosyltransferase II [Chlamydiota bacterium]MBI3277864.1 lipopolysaccharide heptosyltransferase II [Chlamydiota bacterium]